MTEVTQDFNESFIWLLFKINNGEDFQIFIGHLYFYLLRILFNAHT